MWAIWVKYLLPQALDGCPKCKKLPNLVTLIVTMIVRVEGEHADHDCVTSAN